MEGAEEEWLARQANFEKVWDWKAGLLPTYTFLFPRNHKPCYTLPRCAKQGAAEPRSIH